MPKKVEQYKKLQKNKQGKNKYTAEYKLNNPILPFFAVFFAVSFALLFHKFNPRCLTNFV